MASHFLGRGLTHTALKRTGGTQGRPTLLHAHSHTRMHAQVLPLDRAVGLWPCSWGSCDREQEEQAPHSQRVGSLLAARPPATWCVPRDSSTH